MQRRWVLVAAGVVVAALLVVAQVLMTRSTPTSIPVSGSGTSAGSETTGTSTPTVGVRQAPTTPPPGLKNKPIAPSGPEQQGVPLARLSSAPPNLMSGLATGILPPNASYRVRVRPVGYGPGSKTGATLVVVVGSLTPLAGAPASQGLRNKNVLVVMDTSNGGMVSMGGQVEGVLTFVPEGKLLVPHLSRAVEVSTP